MICIWHLGVSVVFLFVVFFCLFWMDYLLPYCRWWKTAGRVAQMTFFFCCLLAEALGVDEKETWKLGTGTGTGKRSGVGWVGVGSKKKNKSQGGIATTLHLTSPSESQKKQSSMDTIIRVSANLYTITCNGI